MKSFSQGLRVQVKVIKALIVRELVTRFGRDNIGFLWIVAEPLLFAGLVGFVWTFIRGVDKGGISVVAFVVTGYIPLTFLRHSFGRSAKIFQSNSALLYHRQVKILDFILVRVTIEAIGAMTAYIFAGTVLYFFGSFPIPANVGSLILGWFVYVFFVMSISTALAPLSEMSEVIEKLVPVSVYIAIPFSGVFNLAEWLTPTMREVLMWSPMASGMELMRYGVFGDLITPYYDLSKAFGVSLVLLLVGLTLCRRVRRMITGKVTKSVLCGVDFSINPRERIGLLGRNGAGKSTLIRLIGGVEMPTSGKITRKMSCSWPLGFSGGFQGSLTGYDNARFIARIYDKPYSEMRAFVEEFTELGVNLHMPVKQYSSGMRARLAFALSLAIEFECYLIDEVIMVGDKNFREKCKKHFFEGRRDRALLLASHSLPTVRQYCNRAIVLDNGVAQMYEDVNEAIAVYEAL